MNGSLLLGSRDSTNLRIHSTLGENVSVLFGQSYYEQQVKKTKACDKVTNIINQILQGQMFGPVDPVLAEYLREICNLESDHTFIQTDFESYYKAQIQVESIFVDQQELCRRCLTALSKCGEFSCDQSVISYCQNVWKIKSVEVPNPATNPVQRVRSHNYLHL